VRSALTEPVSLAIPPPATPSADLVAEGLVCRRGERLVFARLSFRLPAGGALVVTGANGSGKSSLLRLVAGLFAPIAGRFLWGAAPLAADLTAHHARLHYVGHLDALKPAMTPREMLAFSAALRGQPSSPEPALERALAAFALDAIADWPCRWLSAGQRRRVALARLLVAPAPLWLLDEPTAGLDADSQARLEQIIATHRAAGGMVMLATHAPIALDAAASLSLDDFTPRFENFGAEFPC
jgi:heme exporter protein A